MRNRHQTSVHLSSSLQFLLFLSLLIFTLSSSAFAQSGDCGTVVTPRDVAAANAFEQLAERFNGERSANHYDIPVAMHIVRQSNGTGGLNPAELTAAIDSANLLFAPLNVEIYEFQPVNFIDENYFYNDMSTDQRMDSLKRYDRVPGAVNIYWVPNSSAFPYCGLSSFTSSAVQGIIMNNACGGTTFKNSTLVHEIGHYFDLYHTHETAFGTECPDEGNCATAGDLICDTPADPNVNGHVGVAPSCTYDNFASPPGGCSATPYSPPVLNIMSYSRQSCRDQLTTQQIQKFRNVMESLRPELVFRINDVAVTPLGIDPLIVPLGDSRDTTIQLHNFGTASVNFSSASTAFGVISITSGIPASLAPNAGAAVTIKYDAGALSSICDLAVLHDTLILNVTAPTSWSVRIPVTVNLALAVPTTSANLFGPSCLKFTTPNTPALGDKSSSALVDATSNVLYDASLLLGLVDGFDTTVYMDMFTQADYLKADGFTSGTDAFGRKTQTLRFATTDARLSGDVVYKYGHNTGGVDSCKQIEIEYHVRNVCDTVLELTAGMAGDFDIDGSGSNDAIVAAPSDLVYVQQGSHVAGFANLQPCLPTRGLQALSNAVSVYPHNALVDAETYQAMLAGNSGNLTGEDVSILLSFGKFRLYPGEERILRAAAVISNSGAADLLTTVANLKSLIGPLPCYLEVPQVYSSIQSAINASASGDSILLAAGTYTGAGNRDLDLQGKHVSIRGAAGAAATIIDCNGTVGTPHRAFRFDSSAEDSNVIIEGVTVRGGYAPPDAPGSNPNGGAVLIMSGAKPRFRNCRFVNNLAVRGGGAISIESTSGAIIEDCVFDSNSCTNEWGGAVYMSSNTSPRISDCSFGSNSADLGGAIGIDNLASPAISRCKFLRNHSRYGGAIVSDQGNASVSFCTFAGNYGTLGAGACVVFNGATSMTFSNCSFVGNHVTPPNPGFAGAIYNESSTVLMDKCLVAGNHGDVPLVCASGGTYTISCTDIFGNPSGNWTGCIAAANGVSGNFSTDPIFCDTSGGDFRVRSSSPCAPANNSCAALIGSENASCGNTPAGSAVQVEVTDSVTVTFTTVSVDGETSVAISGSGPTPPAGYQLVPSDPNLFYDITTTAPHSGDIDVCITYNPAEIAGGIESNLKLFHYDGAQWVDITTSLNTGSNELCGKTNHLSPFIVAHKAFLCGDANHSGDVSISDAVYLIKFIFSGGPSPSPLASGDVNCSGAVTISDVVYLINFIFAGGASPCAACP